MRQSINKTMYNKEINRERGQRNRLTLEVICALTLHSHCRNSSSILLCCTSFSQWFPPLSSRSIQSDLLRENTLSLILYSNQHIKSCFAPQENICSVFNVRSGFRLLSGYKKEEECGVRPCSLLKVALIRPSKWGPFKTLWNCVRL